MGFTGVMLIAVGIWGAIIFLPTVPTLSISLFISTVGLGAFIGYKQKKIRQIVVFGFWIASWGYAFGIYFTLRVDIANTFFTDFMFPIVFPVIVLGTLPFAWFWGWKNPRGSFSPFKHAFVTHFLCVLIIAPFALSAFYDYNVRADTSLPEVINVKVVGGHVSDEGGPSLRVETPDGNSTFWVSVTFPFYDEHDIGSSFEVIVRKGTLGYQWVEGYSD